MMTVFKGVPAAVCGALACMCSCATQPQRTEFVSIRCGMTEAEVRDALGSDHDVDGYGPGYYDWWYAGRVIVSFDAEGQVIGVSVPKQESTAQ
jgi:outer membrane protein assembly factor BamE (lipoprotein component of BamABCDE complex)